MSKTYNKLLLSLLISVGTLSFFGCDEFLEKAEEAAGDLKDDLEDLADELENPLNDQKDIGEALVEVDPLEFDEDAIEEFGDYDVSDYGGGSNSADDKNDSTALKLVQHFPENGATAYPGSIVQIFFDDVILKASLDGALVVTKDGNEVEGEINLNPDKIGGSVLTFSPRPAFEEGESYTITVNTALRDNGDNQLDESTSFSFTIGSRPDTSCDGRFDDKSGLIFEGDGAILQGTSEVPAQNGTYAAISTSEKGALSGTAALKLTTSRMICFPENDVTKLSFAYNFISGEFNEWVESPYDDTAMLTITDSEGKTISQTITSVKAVGKDGNSSAGDFYGFNKTGLTNEDSFCGQTGWTSKEISFARTLTPPVTITFSIQDVADEIVDSALLIDEMSFK